MTKKRYIPQDNQCVTADEFDRKAYHESVYEQLGVRFPLRTDDRGHTMYDPADIPSEVSENDVQQAVRDNHPHR